MKMELFQNSVNVPTIALKTLFSKAPADGGRVLK